MSVLAHEPIRTERLARPMDAATIHDLVVTVDEVRALARLRGADLPAALADDGEADSRVDAAAVRGLVARGLAAVDDRGLAGTGAEVVPVPGLGALLDVLDAAVSFVEVDLDEEGDERRAVAVAGPAGTAALIEGPAGLWRVVDGVDLVELVTALARPAVVGPEPAGAYPADGGFSCPAAAHVEADDRLASGDTEGAEGVLVAAGVAVETAHAWAVAVADRRAAVAVHAAHAEGPGRWRLDELRVVVGPDGRRWRLDVVDGPAVGAAAAEQRWDDHHQDRPGRPDDVLAGLRSVATCVDAGAVRAALAEMCEGATP